jgi:predicted ATPase/DNA-binding SARP family transcriptional activator
MLQLHLFGAFEVARDGEPIPNTAWPRRKALTLLKLLATQPDHQLHKERVLDCLWPHTDAVRAGANLYHTLHVLRQTLEPNLRRPIRSHYITLTANIVRLGAGGQVWTDLVDFDQTLRLARDAADPVPLLEQALALYRGPLLADDPYEEWALDTRDQYRQRVADARVRLASLYVERRRHDTAIELLRMALADDPANEALHRQLMTIYAQMGRRTEALRQYELCVTALAAELELAPAPETIALAEQIRSSILGGATQTAPITAIGTSATPPGNLPATLTPLFGRTQEIAALQAHLERPDARLLTLIGMAGVGKTRLALAVAHASRNAFSDGSFVVDLAPLREPDLLATTIAQTLGVTAAGDQPAATTLAQYVADKRMLLVLDNFEHVLAAAPQVTALLTAAPGLTILVTSRTALRVSGESVITVAPLELPNIERLPSLDELAQSPAIALFVACARAIRADFRLAPDNAATIAAICIRLDGLPLAIELAAARSAVLPPPALLEQLEHRLAVLTRGPRDVAPRHQTLRGALDWSYALLTPGEQQLLARLSVFTGGWSLAAAAAVCQDAPEDASALLDDLTSLQHHSLIIHPPHAQSQLRFSMLETVREYAHDQRSARHEVETLQRRHAEYMTAFAETADTYLRGSEQLTWFAQLEQEADNLRAALTWCFDGGDTALGLRLASALSWFWYTRSHFAEGLHRLTMALDYCQGAPTEVQVRLYTLTSIFMTSIRDNPRGLALARQAVLCARQVDYRHGVAFALLALIGATLDHGNRKQAVIYGTEALMLARALDEPWLIAAILVDLAPCLTPDAALAALEEARELAQTVGDRWLQSTIHHRLVSQAIQQGHLQHAATLINQGLVFAQELHDQRMIAILTLQHGLVTLRQGNVTEAEAHAKAALALGNTTGVREVSAWARLLLGYLALDANEAAPAAHNLTESLRLAQETGSAELVTYCLLVTARIAAHTGQYTQAARLGSSAMRFLSRTDGPIHMNEHSSTREEIALLRKHIGYVRMAAAWAAGRMLRLDQALAEANAVLMLVRNQHPTGFSSTTDFG